MSPFQEPPHDDAYFVQRRIRLDRRGPLAIDPTSHWGFDIHVVTLSHDPNNWTAKRKVAPVVVGPHAWICSNVILYNCVIGAGAIVAIGTVVRSCEVAPWTMVAGNPARVIARCPGGAPGEPWVYDEEKWRVLA